MTVNSPEPASSTLATRLRNFSIVLVAVALSVALFLGLRTQATTVSVTDLAKNSTPFEVAMANENPTLIEFYANWCTTCMAMAPEIKKLEQEFDDRVNFVMLNVDNTKWLPEIAKYRVDGIPHFVFLNPNGEAIASAIGEIPGNVLHSNLDALLAEKPLPFTTTKGQMSRFKAPTAPSDSSSSDPRSHGAQVVD
ncbi:thioredoxin domain-containing protein [Oxynema aestuarii]|jgi:thiol-disulfide isomerase/thioredoxin|uniref:Redoxin family protein n=1 Tax=Oxynema aestuarii AP17 TaxID=2064643 RepID=A0A6H1TXS8_9CYAN|nr:thioredoxin domain-containing protein [Oxynema aestuarii]QIZ70730.1 redoxin family protein [Oxynema aestuarii AP17]RMH71603.1 MAG: thiol:disulfide interchange protein [Cyanobacteria bacterium J007]